MYVAIADCNISLAAPLVIVTDAHVGNISLGKLMSKSERIEQINKQIVLLLLDRARAQRRQHWTHEESIWKQIEQFENQIKQIEAEDA